MIRTTRARLAALLSLVCLLSSQADGQTLRFTAIPDQNTARLTERFGKVADYLARTLDVEVEYIPVKTYAASVAAFKNDEVQLAWFGGLSGVQARRAVSGSRAIAQGAEDPAFVTYFIANASTRLAPSAAFPGAIRGCTFTFGSKGSTSGRLMPEYHIRGNLGAPTDVFRRVGFSGDHSKTIALVQSGAYEVGAVNFKVWKTEVAAGTVDTTKVTVIWKTPPYPDYNWSIRGDVDQTFRAGFADRVARALVDMTDEDLLRSFPRARFIPADNEMYRPILETAVAVGIIED